MNKNIYITKVSWYKISRNNFVKIFTSYHKLFTRQSFCLLKGPWGQVISVQLKSEVGWILDVEPVSTEDQLYYIILYEGPECPWILTSVVEGCLGGRTVRETTPQIPRTDCTHTDIPPTLLHSTGVNAQKLGSPWWSSGLRLCLPL